MGTKKGKLLIVDDDKNVLDALTQLLEPEFELVKTATSPNLIPGVIHSEKFDLFLLDMNFSAGVHTGNEGIFWMKEILKYEPHAVIVFITAYGDIEMAVKAIKEGATDFVLKPWDNDKLIATLLAALVLSESRNEIHSLRNKQKHLAENIDKQYSSIIGKSLAIQKIFDTIEKIAKTDTNVLILGENGTGKELIAREIHRKSNRSGEVFFSIDMGSISESLFESEIFGHNKGAFTDAKEDRPGRIETASNGTLFLDEIGNLSISMQAKLLKVLESRQVTRLGSNIATRVDIRLISATNKNIKEMIRKNLFREDLFYRINTIEIEIPPLRERGDDIVPLARFFLTHFARKYEKPYLKINHQLGNILKKYHWPGNVRELRHTIERAVILCESNTLKPKDFFIPETTMEYNERSNPITFSEIEKEAIQNALKNNRGSVYKAAIELGLARQTLYNKMQKYGI